MTSETLFVIWKWPFYAYLEKHRDDDENNLSNDMLTNNSENHKTAIGVKALGTVNCVALPAYGSGPLNFILLMWRIE
jgi:hypothetical protein